MTAMVRTWLALLILTIPGLSACGSDPLHQPLPEGTVVLAFGDSVTYGTGAQPGEDYPSLLAQKTGWEIINAGIPGDTAQKAKHRLAELLEQHQPELVIVELGGNDFLRKRQASRVKQDLQSILNTSQDSGAITVLIAVPRLSLLRAGVGALNDADIYAELATDTPVVLVEDIFSDVLSDAALRADPVHPNAEGYQVFTRELMKALKTAGLVK
jgi:acyl-CoA thioesterase-1